MNPSNMMPGLSPPPPQPQHKKKRRTSEQVIKDQTVNQAKKNREDRLIPRTQGMVSRDIGLIGITKTRIADVDDSIILLKDKKKQYQHRLKHLRFRKRSNLEKIEMLKKRQTAAGIVLEAVASSSSSSFSSSDSSSE